MQFTVLPHYELMTPLTAQFVLGNSGEGLRVDTLQWEDRQLVIRKYLALEALLADVTLLFLRKINPVLNADAAREELLIDGPLGSASKMTLFLMHAGVIDRDMADDLRSLCKLRHRYAHDHGRGQLKDEPDLMKLLSNTNTFKQGRALLSGVDEQGVLVCLFAKLMSEVSAVRCALGTD